MPKNKILSNYLSTTYDKEKNLDTICSKIKTHEIKKKKLLNIAAVLIITIFVGSIGTSIYAKRKWEISYKEFENRGRTYSEPINLAISNGLEQNLDMDYLYKDGIGIKIDSLLLTNDSFKMNVNFQFEDYSNLDSVNFQFGYAIYDEHNNIYYISERFASGTPSYYQKYRRFLAKELNLINYFWEKLPIPLAHSSNIPYCISSKEGNLILETSFQTPHGFPKTKKLYIRIFDPGFSYAEYKYYYTSKGVERIKLVDSENHSLSNSEWQFEINIPDVLYNAEVIDLTFAEKTELFELEKAELSDTGLIINLNLSEDFSYTREVIFEVVNNSDEVSMMKISSYEEPKLSMYYDLTKDDLKDGIYLHVVIPELNLDKTIQLIKK